METKKTLYEHCYLKGFFVSQKMSTEQVARDVLGITRQSLNNKLSNKTRFSLDDIEKIRNYFNLTDKQVKQFFNSKKCC